LEEKLQKMIVIYENNRYSSFAETISSPIVARALPLMLVDFRVENFRSIAAMQGLSMVASADDSRSETLIKRDKLRLLPVAAIYGANASGKSNLLKALGFLRNFVATSATQTNLGDPLPWVVPFRLDNKWSNQPSRFEVAVMLHGSRYEYAVCLTPKYVQSESLYVTKPGGRRAKRFTREYNPQSKYTEWEIPGVGRKEEKLLTGRTRDNGLLLSRAAELNFHLAGELFLWFTKSLWAFDLSQAALLLMQQTAGMLMTDPTLKSRVLQLLKDADFGITEIQAESKPFVLAKETPEPLKRMIADMSYAAPMQTVDVRTTHLASDQTPVFFSLQEDESQGTQRLFAIAGPIINALDHGATVVIDEMECSMHSLLAQKLVGLFANSESNPRGGQLIFATHDSSLMNESLLRRDQMWIAQKRKNGDTELYSLYDIEGGDKPRKNEAFQKNYLSGQYGGVPQFGPIFEDLEKP
jgi:uncharacterized protein